MTENTQLGWDGEGPASEAIIPLPTITKPRNWPFYSTDSRLLEPSPKPLDPLDSSVDNPP